MKFINIISLLILIILFFTSCGINKTKSNISSVGLELYGKNVGSMKSELLLQFETEFNHKKIYKTDIDVPIIGIISIQFKNGDKHFYHITGGEIIYKDNIYWILKSPILEKYWGLDEEKMLSL